MNKNYKNIHSVINTGIKTKTITKTACKVQQKLKNSSRFLKKFKTSKLSRKTNLSEKSQFVSPPKTLKSHLSKKRKITKRKKIGNNSEKKPKRERKSLNTFINGYSSLKRTQVMKKKMMRDSDGEKSRVSKKSRGADKPSMKGDAKEKRARSRNLKFGETSIKEADDRYKERSKSEIPRSLNARGGVTSSMFNNSDFLKIKISTDKQIADKFRGFKLKTKLISLLRLNFSQSEAMGRKQEKKMKKFASLILPILQNSNKRHTGQGKAHSSNINSIAFKNIQKLTQSILFALNTPKLSPYKDIVKINISPVASNCSSPNSQDSVETKDIKITKDISLSSINTQDNMISRDLISFYSPEEYMEKHREKNLLPFPQSPESYQDFRLGNEESLFKKESQASEDRFVKIIDAPDLKKMDDYASEEEEEKEEKGEKGEVVVHGKKILFSSTGDNSSVLRKEDLINRILAMQDKLDFDESVNTKIQNFEKKRLRKFQR